MDRRRWLLDTLGTMGWAALPAAAKAVAGEAPGTPLPAARPPGGAPTTAAAASGTGTSAAPAQSPPRPAATAPATRYPPVLPGLPLSFPRDHGAHPAWRTEWWYVTGWLQAGARPMGFQITFFRSRTGHDDRNPSRFAPKQLLLAHLALAVDGEQRLRHAQRAARTGFGLAGFAEDDTDVSVGDWRLRRTPEDRYLAAMPARDFALDLSLDPGAPPFLQGDAGYSRKGPRPEQASRYYSRAQMRVAGRVRVDSAWMPLDGRAWLDHEWSSELLDADALGWDWVGLNLDDGSALMAFRIRRRDGSMLWSHARWIGSPAEAGAPVFEPLRLWRSARSGATYPVAMRLTVGERRLALQPLFDDQELDARSTTATIYWEGAVRVLEAGREVGRGYLELTGYAGALRL